MTDEPQPRRRGLLVPLGAASAGVLVLSATLFGARATASLPMPSGGTTGGAAGTGTLSLVLLDRGAGFSQPVSGLAPGDVVVRDVDLVAGGTLPGRDLRVSVVAAGSPTLLQDGTSTRALRVSVGVCDALRPEGRSCPVPLRPLLTAVPVADLAAPSPLGLPDLVPDRPVSLQVAVALPEQAETTRDGVRPVVTVQDQVAELRWEFRTRQ